MPPLQHYRELCHQLDSLDDRDSVEADLVREEMDVAWNDLTDEEKSKLASEDF